jgi:hypothetical protein
MYVCMYILSKIYASMLILYNGHRHTYLLVSSQIWYIDLEKSYVDDFVDDDNNNTTKQSNDFKKQCKDKELLRNADR